MNNVTDQKKSCINMSVRFKNPWFWIGVIGIILTSMNITAENCSTWPDLFNTILCSFDNPFKVGSAVMAVLGVIVDPTTIGMGDSERALTYIKPKK